MKKLFALLSVMTFLCLSTTMSAQVFGIGKGGSTGSVSEKDGNIHIEGTGHQKTFTSEGGVLHIEGASNTITVNGSLSKVIIDGAVNTVYVDKVSSVKIEGAGTKVYYKSAPTKSGKPAISIFGAGSGVVKK